jgi:hypothetical protein
MPDSEHFSLSLFVENFWLCNLDRISVCGIISEVLSASQNKMQHTFAIGENLNKTNMKPERAGLNETTRMTDRFISFLILHILSLAGVFRMVFCLIIRILKKLFGEESKLGLHGSST